MAQCYTWVEQIQMHMHKERVVLKLAEWPLCTWTLNIMCRTKLSPLI